MSDTPTIPIRLPQLEAIEQKLIAVLEGRAPQAWYTLEQAHRRKYGGEGGVSLQVLRNTHALQPRGGLPDGWQSGRKAWRGETIDEWMLIDDFHLEAYLKACGSAARVPPRILEANARHRLEYPTLAQEVAS